MDRDEILEDLAMNVAEWPTHVSSCVSTCGRWAPLFDDEDDECPVFFHRDGGSIQKDDWLQRRAELINKPSWDDAPEWARGRAQDADGRWQWLAHPDDAKPYRDGFWLASYKQGVACQGAIPNGHDWRQTLERRPMFQNFRTENRMDITTSLGATAFETDGSGDSYMFMTLEEHELPAEERHDCDRCGGAWWSPHNTECPCLSSKQARYRDAQGDDWIDEFARTATAEEFRGAMRFTIGKYNRRMGRKDEMVEEIRKMRDYCDRWMAYEEGE